MLWEKKSDMLFSYFFCHSKLLKNTAKNNKNLTDYHMVANLFFSCLEVFAHVRPISRFVQVTHKGQDGPVTLRGNDLIQSVAEVKMGVLVKGKSASALPPPRVGTVGKQGVECLLKWHLQTSV